MEPTVLIIVTLVATIVSGQQFSTSDGYFNTAMP
jgi:hypothetical protein